MPILSLNLNGDNAWPDLKDRPVHNYNEPIEMVLLDGGMASGKPSVAIRLDIDGGSIIAQTSAALFVNAARLIEAKYPNLFD